MWGLSIKIKVWWSPPNTICPSFVNIKHRLSESIYLVPLKSQLKRWFITPLLSCIIHYIPPLYYNLSVYPRRKIMSRKHPHLAHPRGTGMHRSSFASKEARPLHSSGCLVPSASSKSLSTWRFRERFRAMRKNPGALLERWGKSGDWSEDVFFWIGNDWEVFGWFMMAKLVELRKSSDGWYVDPIHGNQFSIIFPLDAQGTCKSQGCGKGSS